MMNIFRLFLFCCLVGLAPGLAAEDARRIAIISMSDLDEPAAVLTAALSSTPGIALVERDQIAAAVRERNIQVQNLAPGQVSALGKVLGAQAILVLDRPAPGEAFSCRLIAVDSGLTIAESQAAWPAKDPSGWASLLARQLAAAMSKIPTSPGTTALVVNLGVRSPTTGPSARQLERASSFAIGRSLTGLPGVFVLDRTQMREANWEKQLAESSQGRFWSGTWLLDGNIQDTGSKLIYEGQLRPLAQGAARPFKVEGATPEEIGKAISAAVAAILGAQPAPAAADTNAESRLFQEQAEWAFRWKLYEEAERAADASWYLGNKTEALGLIRSLSAARISETQLWAMGGTYDNSVTYLVGLESLSRAFSNLIETIRHAGQEPSPKFLADATEMFVIASKLLKQRYFKNSPPVGEEAAALKSLRDQLRLLAPVMSEECQRAWTKMSPRDKISARSASRPPMSFYIESLTFAPLWGDTPEQSAGEFEKALAAVDRLDPEVSRSVRKAAILDRENHGPIMPIVVAWDAADRPRVSEVRNQLLDRMMKGPPERQIEACFLGLMRYYNFQDKKLLSKVPDEVIENQARKLYDTLTALSPQIIAGQIDTDTIGEAIILAGQVVEIYERPALSAKVADLQKKLLLRLLQAGWAGAPFVYNPLFRGVSFTDAERDQCLAAIKAIPRAKGWYPDHFTEKVVQQTNVGPSFRPTPPPLPAVANGPAPAFRFPIGEGASSVSVKGVIVCEGRYLARVQDYPHFLKIFELDPEKGGQKVLFEVLGNDPKFAVLSVCEAWTADGKFLYFVGHQTLYRVDRATGKLEAKRIPLLSPDNPVIRAIAGQLYVVQSGALIRIDPVSFDAELMASAKRRPAQTVLDDQETLDVDPIELDGAMVLAGRDKLYRWNPSTRNFDSTPLQRTPRSRQAYDRNFVLRLQSELELTVRHPGDSPGYWIVVDPNRTGVSPVIKGVWPPKLKFGGQNVGTDYGMSAGGSVLYQLCHIYPTGLHLVAYGPAGNHFVPMGDLEPGRLSLYRTLIGSEGGVLVWGTNTKELLFYSFKDFEKYPSP